MPDFSILTNNIDMYLEGFKYTVMSSVIALIGSFILGIILAVMRIAPIRILNWLGAAIVEFVRNIPLVLIAFIFYFALPVIGITLNGFVAGTVTLTVYTAAFCEVIRAGILSVAKGQMEAARSSGLTYTQAMYHVVLPQAMKIVIPPLGNQFLNLVKLFHTRNYRWYGFNVSRRFNFNEDVCYVRRLYICRDVLFNINNSAQYVSALFRKTLSKGGGVNGF